MSRQLLPALVHSSSYLGPKRPSAAGCGELSLGGARDRWHPVTIPLQKEDEEALDILDETICVIQTKTKVQAVFFLFPSIVASHIVSRSYPSQPPV